MYRRKPQGWIKHLDFIVLDLASLLLSFFLACLTKYGLCECIQFVQYGRGAISYCKQHLF